MLQPFSKTLNHLSKMQSTLPCEQFIYQLLRAGLFVYIRMHETHATSFLLPHCPAPKQLESYGNQKEYLFSCFHCLPC